jgi:hypothetical protein
MTTEEKTLLARIENLEQQNRRIKQGAMISLVAVASIALAGGLLAQTQKPKTATKPKTPAAAAAPATPVVPDKIESQSFVLNDSSGRERAELAMGGTGPSFRLLDQTGNAEVTIGLNDGSPSGPLVLLSDPDHKSALTISVQQGAGANLSLRGDQNAMVHMGVTKDGTTVELFDQDGFSASIGNGVKVSKSGKPQDTSAASITLYNKDRKVLWSAP